MPAAPPISTNTNGNTKSAIVTRSADERGPEHHVAEPTIGILADERATTDRYLAEGIRRYVTAVKDACRARPLVLTPDDVSGCAPSRLDGLILTGSASNVHHRAYAGATCPGPFDHHRDEAAGQLVETCMERSIPLLGVCRGMQEMAVALGGKLRHLPHPHTEEQDPVHWEDESLPRDDQYRARHAIRVTPNGMLSDCIRNSNPLVNSLHRQAVADVRACARVEARTADGVVEALSVPGHPFALGVQWHPEWHWRSDEISQSLFILFGWAARGR